MRLVLFVALLFAFGCSSTVDIEFSGPLYKDSIADSKAFLSAVSCPEGYAMTTRQQYYIHCTKVVE